MAVVGAGPAGLAAAAACADATLTTVLVAPEPDAVWPQTYGCWVDELRELGLGTMAAVSWPSVRVIGHRAHQLPRGYAVLDNARLHDHLLCRLAANGDIVADRVERVQHFTWGSRLLLASGATVTARVVIDASGSVRAAGGGALVRGGGPPAAYQSAYGLVARFTVPPVPPGSCVLMDWSPASGPGPGGRPARAPASDPTFLYALDLGDGRFLVEETSLARRQPLPVAELRARLDARLAATGASPSAVEREETVLIAMGGPVPGPQPVVATGAAAGLVHPATGYSVAAGLRAAPVLAAALQATAARGGGPDALARAGWDAVWPAGRRRARQLERYGLERLLRLPGPGIRSFFDAFFSLPADRWAPYLSGTASSGEVAATMAAVFRRSPASVRRVLAGAPR